MKKVTLVVAAMLALICASAYAADDLLNCKWENGETMEPGICGTLRNSLPSDENAKLHQDLTRIANEKQAAEEMERIRLEEQEVERIRKEGEEKEAARVSLCKKIKTRALTSKEIRSISDNVKDLLKDPDSAKFKWMRLNGTSKFETYCGLVNAKNSYGGYTGYSIFSIILINGESKHAMIENGETDAISDICKSACYEDFARAKP